MPYLARAKALLFAILLCLAGLTGAGHAAEPSRPFGIVVEEWTGALDLIEQELGRQPLTAARSDVLRRRLAEIRAAAIAVEATAREELKPVQSRAAALGPPPPEDAPPEPEEITEQRQAIAEDIALYEGRIKQVQLVLSRVDQLQKDLQARAFKRLVEELLHSAPLPLAPDTVAKAVPELFGHLGRLARSPIDWWDRLSPEQRDWVLFRWLILVLVLALAGGWALRYALLRWFGPNPAIEDPAYARRLVAAIAVGLANGIVPALLLGGMLFRATSQDRVISGLFAEVVIAFCSAAILFVLAWALPRAVLAPHLPSWRLVPITPANAVVISRRVTYLAAVFAIDLFFDIASRTVDISIELLSFYLFMTNSLEALGVLALMRGHLWSGRPLGPADQAAAAAAASARPQSLNLGPFWTSLRLLISVVAAAAIPITLMGYINLGAYVMKNLVISGGALGVLFLVRGLGRELIGAALRTEAMRDRLAVRHRTRSAIKFWVRVLYDLTLLAAGIVLVLLVWGVPLAEITARAQRILAGVTVGNVTISLADVLVAFTVFAVTLIVTRMIQRLLSERVLPQTRFDIGIRHSLSTGFGYLGIVLAAVLGVAALGLDLTNLAIIAGALSVGIGFGLQNIVNNFVSGLILLVERPIKVGDWIVSGQHEGFVKRISLRATEIETFQRASIIVPNSDLLTSALVNWTHKDHLGRIDLPVEVAYGSDARQVMQILQSCLEANEDILDEPEPRVLFLSFGDSGLGFEMRGFIADIAKIYGVETDLRLAVYSKLAEAGIEIPFPQRDIHIRDAEPLAEALAGSNRSSGSHESAAQKPDEDSS